MASKQETENALQLYKKALIKLEEVLDVQPVTEIVRDATIQRFEFTFELLWKLIKKIVHLEKLTCYSPKSCFKVAFQMGLIPTHQERLFVDMLDYRNMTTHTYNETTAESVYQFISQQAIIPMQEIYRAIQGYLAGISD